VVRKGRMLIANRFEAGFEGKNIALNVDRKIFTDRYFLSLSPVLTLDRTDTDTHLKGTDMPM